MTQLDGSDAALFEAWCQGDRSAGSQLIDSHFQSIYRFFNNKVATDIEDLVQQTFLRCVEHRDSFRQQSTFRTFLFVVARNALFDYLRAKHRQRQHIDFGATSLIDLGQSVTSLVARGEEGQLLAQALRYLPVDLQLTLELHYWEDMPTSEMAEVLAVPVGTVKSRLRRGRELLAEHMQELLKRPLDPAFVEQCALDLGQDLRGPA